MDVAKLSRRTAVLLGIVGVVPAAPEVLADTKAERRRRRRRSISLNCPPAPNCTLTNGSTCTCTGEGEPCICDSCCPTPPVCPDVCPTGQSCQNTENPCPTGETCQPGECPKEPPVCEKVTGDVCHRQEFGEGSCSCPEEEEKPPKS
jgi:hypothetical protein